MVLVGLAVVLITWGVRYTLMGDTFQLSQVIVCEDLDAKLQPLNPNSTFPYGNRQLCLTFNYQGAHEGDRLLIEDLSFTLPRAGIVGIIGPNGAGKTTLFRMLTGQEAPDNGSVTVGDTVELAYVDQSRDTLDPELSVYEEITGGVEHMKVGNREIHGRAYCASFNFKGSDQQKKVGELSGGERNRVHLAKVLKSGGNVLLLDEPTNDLDVDTLRALELYLIHISEPTRLLNISYAGFCLIKKM